MSDDFLHKMLQSSMDREAKRMASNGGVTEQDRYGNLLDCVKGRDLENEEVNKQLDRLSAMHKNAEEGRKQRKRNLLNGQEICVRLLGMLRIGNRIELMIF